MRMLWPCVGWCVMICHVSWYVIGSFFPRHPDGWAAGDPAEMQHSCWNMSGLAESGARCQSHEVSWSRLVNDLIQMLQLLLFPAGKISQLLPYPSSVALCAHPPEWLSSMINGGWSRLLVLMIYYFKPPQLKFQGKCFFWQDVTGKSVGKGTALLPTLSWL